MRDVAAVRFQTPPVIDGDLSDPCWADAPKADRFVDSRLGTPAADQTVVFVGYDNQNVYVGFHAYDTQPAGIVARQRKHELFPAGDDWFSFCIDAFHTHTWNGRFWVVINPDGTQFTHLADDRWNKPQGEVTWKSAARIVSDGWTGEMAIPWKLFQYPSLREPATLGLNFTRFQSRTGIKSWWSNIGESENYELEGHWVGVRLPPFRRGFSAHPHPSPQQEMLEHLEEDLLAGPAVIAGHWSLPAVQNYVSRWIDGPLPPALRRRLGSVVSTPR